MRIGAILCSVLLSMGATTCALAENLLPNADFTGGFREWTLEDYQDSTLANKLGAGVNFRVDEDGSDFVAVLEPDGDFSVLTGSLSIPCEPNSKYVLRYEVKSDLDGSRFLADICTLGADRAYLRSSNFPPEYDTINKGRWEKREVVFETDDLDAYIYPRFIVRGDSRVFLRELSLEKKR